jgi:hypothetical protein
MVDERSESEAGLELSNGPALNSMGGDRLLIDDRSYLIDE